MEGKRIKLGEVFDTYEQFVRILMNNSSEQNYVSFYKRDSMSLQGGKKNKTAWEINLELKYYHYLNIPA